MIINHKQTCIIHFVDCRKALHSYFTHHTRKYFGCERRRGLHGGRHVVARVDVLGTPGLLARPAGRSDWPAENYPVRTSRVMRKAGAARRRLAEKLACQAKGLATISEVHPRLTCRCQSFLTDLLSQLSYSRITLCCVFPC